MAAAIKGNAVVGQSGGPTAVINQSLVGVIEAMRARTRSIGCWGHGTASGIVGEKFTELKGLPRTTCSKRVAVTPSAALGSTRDKPDEAYCHKIFEAFAKNDVRYFFYIGGNDSADTCPHRRRTGRRREVELRVFHIPKTIDNDLRVTDHCPGYGSAARFVASAIMPATTATTPRCRVSRSTSSWAATPAGSPRPASSAAATSPTARTWSTCPKRPLTEEKFVNEVAEVYAKLGRCLVAMSEGVEDEKGMAWGEKIVAQAKHDSHGNVQLSGSGALGDFMAELVKTKVAAKLGGKKKLRVRADTFGYLQRSFAGYASPVDQAEAQPWSAEPRSSTRWPDSPAARSRCGGPAGTSTPSSASARNCATWPA